MTAQYLYFSTGQKPRWGDPLEGPRDEYWDPLFDRLVIVEYHDGKSRFMAPGAIIGFSKILTSYNPFRTTNRNNLRKINVIVLKERIVDGDKVTYHKFGRPILCFGSIGPYFPQNPGVWHGINSTRNSPLHDLMVITVRQDFWKADDKWLHLYNSLLFDLDPTKNKYRVGPVHSYMATLDDELEQELRFASLRFKDDQHIADSYHLRSVEFKHDDKVLEDCDEWLPREWGRFICIKNTGNFQGVGSGAMLYGKKYEMIYGVGSFLLKKGRKSVLVFTDVRPYFSLVHSIC